MNYEGACYCGAISHVYSTELPVSSWSLRACQCAFCRAHGATSASDPGGTLVFGFAEPEEVNRYRFARKTADFLICRRCGIYIRAIIATVNGAYGIANLNALLQTLDGLGEPEAACYDAESFAGRVRRREDRWTPVVL